MAGMMGSKKKLSINLSFLTVIDSSKQPAGAQKAPKNFKEPNGVVGLRFLAAMNDDDDDDDARDSIFLNCSRAAISCNSSSDPVPILGNNQKTCLPKNSTISMEEMELCEEYTCVISHLGENLIEKREYFEADFLGNKDERVSYSSSVNCGSGETDSFLIADFLSSCFLCKKRLHGLDIFMYRGETAFCSAECRYSQMTIDEQTDKYKSGLRNTIEYSVSPCSGTLQFFAGVAAA